MGSLDPGAEDGILNWLVETLDARCPGFLDNKGAFTAKAAKARPLAFRLEDWIDEQVFGFAKKDGLFNAITYYAIRDPGYQRAEVCWSECVDALRLAPSSTPTPMRFTSWP